MSASYNDGLEAELESSISAAAEQAKRPLSRQEVEEIIGNLISSLSGDLTGNHLSLFHELQSLASYIESTKQEIASLSPTDISDTHIPSATDELGAIVGATEDATGRILDSCEMIEEVAGTVEGAASDKLTEAVTNMYEACNFQDITGQRITKVVTTLKHIDQKIHALLSALGEYEGERPDSAEPVASDKAEGPSDEELLNGPQLPSNAIDQDEIDRLLASFD